MAHTEARDAQLDRQHHKIKRWKRNLRKTKADFLHPQPTVLKTEKAIDELNHRWNIEVSGSNELQNSLCFSLTPRHK